MELECRFLTNLLSHFYHFEISKLSEKIQQLEAKLSKKASKKKKKRSRKSTESDQKEDEPKPAQNPPQKSQTRPKPPQTENRAQKTRPPPQIKSRTPDNGVVDLTRVPTVAENKTVSPISGNSIEQPIHESTRLNSSGEISGTDSKRPTKYWESC